MAGWINLAISAQDKDAGGTDPCTCQTLFLFPSLSLSLRSAACCRLCLCSDPSANARAMVVTGWLAIDSAHRSISLPLPLFQFTGSMRLAALRFDGPVVISPALISPANIPLVLGVPWVQCTPQDRPSRPPLSEREDIGEPTGSLLATWWAILSATRGCTSTRIRTTGINYLKCSAQRCPDGHGQRHPGLRWPTDPARALSDGCRIGVR
jgi:hypothetical protein